MSSLNMKPARPFTVIVEGNIGSGKTTLLNHFKSIPQVITMPEPVSLWRNANGFNLLVIYWK
jgi:ABC-type lipoprotein export system ATPase subunit